MYKEEIIEMVKRIVNQNYLKSIYWFVLNGNPVTFI